MAYFPTWAKNFNDILQREGIVNNAITIIYSGVVSSTRTSIGSSTAVGYGNGFYCKNAVITVNSDIPVGIQILVTEASYGDLFNRSGQLSRNKIFNQTVTIPVNQYFRDFPTITVYTENGDNVTTAKVDISLNGCILTDGQNWDAQSLVRWFGDSISEFSGLPQNNYAKKYELHPFMVNNYLLSKGKDTRLSITAKGGTTSTQGESARLRGFFDSAGKAQYYFYHFGANDASQGVASNIYTENIGKFIDWALASNSGSKIIVLGITPIQDNTVEANAVTLRSAASAYVSGLALSNVYYCELGNAFDRTNNAFYSSADTTGSGIHPNIAGMSAIYDVISAFLLANGIS